MVILVESVLKYIVLEVAVRLSPVVWWQNGSGIRKVLAIIIGHYTWLEIFT